MAYLNDQKLKEFVDLLVLRGLGLYGQEKMAEICYNSGIALTDKNEIEWMEDNHTVVVENLLVNYGSKNLPAKMTAIVLARQHAIPVPQVLLAKKRNRRRSIFKRRKS
ncbi:hypothetical protein NEF87_004971 [Candidatus Lokiarchaeum ossiferum]|uniref:Uncharacterized protein n=1 Tax=Candidatus Lokiarchaeum ossiferum TaxID=2951803 RepID=A0ABY6HYS6_9ARCH|nr:hypothetical protein NEF87_004971 [Candidatus Lokiarchaeum sp. B-35]